MTQQPTQLTLHSYSSRIYFWPVWGAAFILGCTLLLRPTGQVSAARDDDAIKTRTDDRIIEYRRQEQDVKEAEQKAVRELAAAQFERHKAELVKRAGEANRPILEEHFERDTNTVRKQLELPLNTSKQFLWYSPKTYSSPSWRQFVVAMNVFGIGALILSWWFLSVVYDKKDKATVVVTREMLEWHDRYNSDEVRFDSNNVAIMKKEVGLLLRLRNWVLGFGAGDLVLSGASGQSRTVRNVMFINRKLNKIASILGRPAVE